MKNLDKIHEAGENIFSSALVMHAKLVNFQNIAKSCDVPQSHLRVLFLLQRHEEMTMSGMAHAMNISKPNLTPVIDRLILDGHVERKEGTKDRRKLIISLTENGGRYLSSLMDKVKEETRYRLEALSEEDLSALNESVLKIMEILKKI